MIKSALQSSLTNDIKYDSMSVGNLPSNEYLIQTVLLTQNEPTVTFSNLGDYSGIYQHLQLVIVAKSTRADTDGSAYLQFNGDSGTNYNSHYLRGNGSAVESGAYTSSNNNGVFLYQGLPGNTNAANSFGGLIIDILDPFKTTKNTTVKALTGFTGSLNRIFLQSGAWRNTASITSITLDDFYGDFAQYSRFSLYGVTA